MNAAGFGVYIGMRIVLTALGAAISVGLYALGVSVILEPIQESSRRSPESLLGAAFLVLAPIALLIGGFTAGVLLRWKTKHPVWETVIFNPGLWLCAYWLFSSRDNPDFILMTLIPNAIWVLSSWIGVFIGYRLRRGPRPVDPGVCSSCGYNLTGNVSGRCPECGTAVARGYAKG